MNLYPLMRPLLRRIDAERAHGLTIAALRFGLGPRRRIPPDPVLAQELWGVRFANPLGLAAGFDKDARVIAPILDMGFGFTEVGTVTPLAQPGNPKPRVFRLDEDRAVINRLGFNNRGAAAARGELALFRASGRGGIVGVNIGRNKDARDAAADYAAGARTLGALADYLVVNVSSPNTPGLRALQAAGELAALLEAVRGALAEVAANPPVLVKIAPDLADEELADIAQLARKGAMDGLIVCNTTVARPEGLRSPLAGEEGGLSGRPLFPRATALLAELRRSCGGDLPMIGIGGIFGADDAYAKIRAGASLVALYTGLAYEGPELVGDILSGLALRLKSDGFTRLPDAVGADAA